MPLDPQTIRRARRIREEVPILQVLVDYGYPVHPNGGDREQQFPCDLHGDSLDSKPSARVYPASNNTFCFACGIARDSIRIVMEKEGVSFSEACRILESRYNLPPLPAVVEDQASIQENLITTFTSTRTFIDEHKRVDTLLSNLTRDRDLPVHVLLDLFERIDRAEYMFEKGLLDEETAKSEVLRVRQRAFSYIQASVQHEQVPPHRPAR